MSLFNLFARKPKESREQLIAMIEAELQGVILPEKENNVVTLYTLVKDDPKNGSAKNLKFMLDQIKLVKKVYNIAQNQKG